MQIVSALDYLAKRSVIHRDLKLENILITSQGKAKIADFGCSVHSICDKRRTFCGTFEYLAIEMVQKQKYDSKLDLWCLGILIYEMFFKESPFKSENKEQTIEKIKNLHLNFNINNRLISEDS